MLSDQDIVNAITLGDIHIGDGYDLQPSTVDLHLGDEFLEISTDRNQCIDPSKELHYRTHAVKRGEPFTLRPGGFILAHTVEDVGLSPQIAGEVMGKSSLGRLGITAHCTAGFLDSGFNGQITLEISNMTYLPVKLWPGMAICQVAFTRLDSPSGSPYGSRGLGSRYQGQRGTQPSRSYLNFRRLGFDE